MIYIAIFIGFLFLIPIAGIIVLIIYVIRKSTETPTPEFLNQEKSEMKRKVEELKKSILNWNEFGITSISNNLSYSWFKGITRKMEGQIMTLDNVPVVAFYRIERGWEIDCTIVAMSSEFELLFQLNGYENLIYFNEVYLGKIDSQNNLFDSNHLVIGSAHRTTDSETYSVVIQNKEVATICNSTNISPYRRNLFYKSERRPDVKNNPKYFYDGPVEKYQIVDSVNAQGDELKWINAIGIFEAIYYSLDFEMAK